MRASEALIVLYPLMGIGSALREPGRRYRRRYSKRATNRPADGLPAPRRLIEKIMDQIAAGRTVRLLCREKWAPSEPVFYRWVSACPEIAAMYEAAKQARLATLRDQILELADNSIDHEKTKLQIAARQWLFSQLNR